MRRVIHARRGGRPPGVEDKGRKSRGGENRDVLHHLPTLPTSFHGYLRSSAGTIPDTEGEGRGPSVRGGTANPPLPTRAARQNLRSKGASLRGFISELERHPRFRKVERYAPLYSSEFRGHEFLNRPDKSGFFLTYACGVEAGSKWMGFVGMTRFSSSFVFEDSPVLGSFHRNENEVSIFNRINSLFLHFVRQPLRKQR